MIRSSLPCVRRSTLHNGHELTKYTKECARRAVLAAFDLLIGENARADVQTRDMIA